MTRRLYLPIVLLFLTATAHAADEPPPSLKADPAMQAPIGACFRVQALRDTRDKTLVQVMIQSDHPPTPMAFAVALRVHDKTYPVGPMVWNGEMCWWAYDVDLPVDVQNVDVVFTADPTAVRRLQRINSLAVHHLATIWDGTAVVKNAKVSAQSLAGMIARTPPDPKLLPEIYADELEGQSEWIAQFRKVHDVPAARAALEKTLEQKPKDAAALYNLGCLAAAEGQWRAAIERFVAAKAAAGADPLADRAQHQIRQIGGYVADGAGRGDPAAMFTLAIMYDRAWGPARDLQKAKRMYRNAASAGNPSAMTRLGELYAQDLEAATDPKAQAWYRAEMISMYRQAAQLDDQEAKEWLAEHDEPDDTRAAYGQFVARFSFKSLEGKLLVLTVVEPEAGDDSPSTFSWTVMPDGKTSSTESDSRGVRGGDGNALSAAEVARLKELTTELPADIGRLPPPERRVLVQGAGVARVYDRAQLPAKVIELFRASGSRIGAWFPTFSSNSAIDAGPGEYGGFLALSPDGKRLLFSSGGTLQFWSPPTHETLGDLGVQGGKSDIAFSPDGTIAAISGDACQIVDTKTWKIIRDFSEPRRKDSFPTLHDPHFTPDGRCLVLRAGSDTLRFFDTRTWERLDPIPEIPADVLQWRPAKSWRYAVMQTKAGVISLWNAQTKTARELDREAPLLDAAFSPDETQFVIATSEKDGYLKPPLRLFDTATGQLVHELRPAEIGCAWLQFPQWTPDGRYVLAVTNLGPGSTSENISVFSAKTGRHRGDFVDCPTNINGVVILPDGQTLVAGCADGKVRFWDFAAGLRAIEAFEKSLEAPPAMPK